MEHKTIRYAKERRCTCTLYMTEACNLRCTYCYEHVRGSACMPLEVAQRAIRSTFERAVAERVDLVEVLFHGGEPFLAFDRIRAICTWLWAQTWPVPCICYATTNGTLVHGPVAEWLVENKHRFAVGLSLDGTPEMHDRNRSGSFRRIDLDLFLRHWPDQGVKMTPSPETISTLAEGVVYLHRKGFLRNSCTFATGVDYAHDGRGRRVDYVRILSEQFGTLARYYLDNPLTQPVEMLFMHFGAVAAGAVALTDKLCGAGTTMRCWTPDGQCLPCHLFYEVAKERGGALPDFDLSDAEKLTDARCKGCPLLSVCPTCYGGSYLCYGDVARRDPQLCTITKLRALAGSWMVGRMLETPDRYVVLRDLSDDERTMTAAGVMETQRFLQQSGFVAELENG